MSERLRAISTSVSCLLSDLKAAPADARSDELLRELFLQFGQLTPADSPRAFLSSTFLPMLHGTVRRVSKQQPGLSLEDISQQVLSFLLQYLRLRGTQPDSRLRCSQFRRAVKRQVFEWATPRKREDGMTDHYDGEALAPLRFEESFERYAFLRHFLHRCVTKGLLTDAELNLLIDLKLNGTNGEEFADFNGTSSNAVRQRLKRLLAKLRRLAR